MKNKDNRSRILLWAAMILFFGVLCGLIAVVVKLDGNGKLPAELELPQAVRISDVMVADCIQLKPEDFVSGLEDTGISVSFAEPVPNSLEAMRITVIFTDGSRSCSRQAMLRRFHLEQKVRIELGATDIPDIRSFVPDETLDAKFVGKTPDQISVEHCGETTLVIACAGREYQVRCSVEEKIPTQATVVRITTQSGRLPEPDTLVTDIVDHSPVTVAYLKEPDVSVVGSVAVTLLLTDAYGNTATVETVIDVVPDENAPQFEGLEDLYICIGSTISFMEGVRAIDPQDGVVVFRVDAAQLDRNTLGEYVVFYSAEDSDGNVTIMPRKIIVEDVDRRAVLAYAEAALKKIITDGMTLDQKIQAVYSYTKNNIRYAGASNKTSILHAAYEGGFHRQGGLLYLLCGKCGVA